MSESSVSILSAVHEYREIARGLWNTHFKAKFERDQGQDWFYDDAFKTIQRQLFKSIVVYPAMGDVPDDFVLGRPCRYLQVMLSAGWPTTVMINRDQGATHGYWDHPVTTLSSQAQLCFINLFDWNSYGVLDMAMVMAEIVSYPENPALVGHRVLVELMYVDIAYMPEDMGQ